MNSRHKVINASSHDLRQLADDSIDLVVTSPPYPMIGMWDDLFSRLQPEIQRALQQGHDERAFECMHMELEKTWSGLRRVVKPGGIVCINVGDATRTTEDDFKLWSNHARIIKWFTTNGFTNLPNIIWRKPTNAPNKFMGSGMLPAGAYVTLEHEYILIFRKGGKRKFDSGHEKLNRQQSAVFWEERNQWFSDIWELAGTKQKLGIKSSRERSAAYPFEIPYRLINMFSVKGDTILDPFLGTGTTTMAAIASARNSIGYELDSTLLTDFVQLTVTEEQTHTLNKVIQARLQNHLEFVEYRKKQKGEDAFRHLNIPYGFQVMTSQERDLTLNYVTAVRQQGDILTVEYTAEALMLPPLKKAEQV